MPRKEMWLVGIWNSDKNKIEEVYGVGTERRSKLWIEVFGIRTKECPHLSIFCEKVHLQIDANIILNIMMDEGDVRPTPIQPSLSERPSNV